MTEFIKPINTSIEPNTDSKKCKKKKFVGFNEDPSKLHRKLKTVKSQKET